MRQSKDNPNAICWFVAYVRPCQEKTVARQLAGEGIEYYLPIQKEWRKWSDRKVLRDRIVIPRTIFIHCSDVVRRGLFGRITYLSGFLSDRQEHAALEIPQSQMDAFRNVVEKSDKPVEILPVGEFIPGEVVKIIGGPLSGMVCEVAFVKNRKCVCVRMGMLGTAISEVDAASLEKVEN